MRTPTRTLDLTVGGLSASTINRHITASQRIDLPLPPKVSHEEERTLWGYVALGAGVAVLLWGLFTLLDKMP